MLEGKIFMNVRKVADNGKKIVYIYIYEICLYLVLTCAMSDKRITIDRYIEKFCHSSREVIGIDKIILFTDQKINVNINDMNVHQFLKARFMLCLQYCYKKINSARLRLQLQSIVVTITYYIENLISNFSILIYIYIYQKRKILSISLNFALCSKNCNKN